MFTRRQRGPKKGRRQYQKKIKLRKNDVVAGDEH